MKWFLHSYKTSPVIPFFAYCIPKTSLIYNIKPNIIFILSLLQAFLIECIWAFLLPDRIVGNISILSMNSSHHGSWGGILLYLKSVTGCYKNRGLVCILHWYLSTNTQEQKECLRYLSLLKHFFFSNSGHICCLYLYLYCGFIFVRTPGKKLWINMRVGSFHLQSVWPFSLKVHWLRNEKESC